MKHPTRILLIASCFLVPLVLIGCAAGEELVAEGPSEPPPPPKPEPGDFVTVAAGEFIMGSNERPEKTKDKPTLYEPEHTVDLPEFQVGVYEVTNAEFARFQIESDYRAEGDWRRFYNIGLELNPVANVTYQDAEEYCKWLGGRLPTEEEWEKAARGTDGRPFPWGDKYVLGTANTNDAGHGSTVEVGQNEGDVSPYGAHDMFGNVQEWTSSEFKAYPDSPARRDPNFRRRWTSVRGASYAIKGNSFFIYTRGAYPKKAQYGIGFRCVKDVPGAAGEEIATDQETAS